MPSYTPPGGTIKFEESKTNGRHLAVGASGGGGGGSDGTLSFVEEPDFTVTDNGDGTITIQDAQSRFGTRPFQAAPDFFSDNDYDLSDGGLIPDGDTDDKYFNTVNDDWYFRTSSSLKRYDNEPGVIERTGGGSIGDPKTLSNTDPSYLFGRFWKRFEVGPFENENNSSHKFVRCWNGGSDDLRISWTQKHLTISNRNTGEESTQTVYDDWSGVDTAWNLYEMEVDYSTNTITCWLNGAVIYTYTDQQLVAKTADNLGFRQIAGFNTAFGTEEITGQTHWNSDVYADRSPARVLINEFATWSERESSGTGTLIEEEIQLPTAWSADEITVSKRLGPISTPSGYGLYVIDPNGDPLKVAEVE